MSITEPIIIPDQEQSIQSQPLGTDAAHKTKRRSKNDALDRNFNCGCGKSYLSYPALYTHIKTKHDGVAPEGTTQKQPGAGVGRGRPKKEEGAAKPKEDEETNTLTAVEDDEEKSVDLSNSIELLVQYLAELEPDAVKLGENQKEVDPVEHFPLDIFVGQEDDYRIVYDLLKQMRGKDILWAEVIDPKTQLKQVAINLILAFFISEVSGQLTKEFYREFVFFVLMYRRALNKIGWETKAKISGKGQTGETIEFCETTNNGEYIPEICNEFISDLLPEFMREYDITGFKVIGFGIRRIKNAICLTEHFCNWLNFQKYTYSRLKAVNSEEY